jgi:hypothetical protein
MHSTIWGWIAWDLMHLISFTYPKKPTDIDKQMYKQFYISIGDIIPCKVCRSHYKQRIFRINAISIFLNRKNLTIWLVNLHNEVNNGLHKKVINYNEATRIYNDMILHIPYYNIYKILQIFINTVHTNYTNTEINANINFYNSLSHVLPCPILKKQYSDIIKIYPINNKIIFDKDTLQKWYSTIKSDFEKDLIYKNNLQLINYIISDNKHNKPITMLFDPKIYNIKSLNDITYINNGSISHSIYQNLQLYDNNIVKIKPFKKVSNKLKVLKSDLINATDLKIKKLSKNVPKRMRR